MSIKRPPIKLLYLENDSFHCILPAKKRYLHYENIKNYLSVSSDAVYTLHIMFQTVWKDKSANTCLSSPNIMYGLMQWWCPSVCLFVSLSDAFLSVTWKQTQLPQPLPTVSQMFPPRPRKTSPHEIYASAGGLTHSAHKHAILAFKNNIKTAAKSPENLHISVKDQLWCCLDVQCTRVFHIFCPVHHDNILPQLSSSLCCQTLFTALHNANNRTFHQ